MADIDLGEVDGILAKLRRQIYFPNPQLLSILRRLNDMTMPEHEALIDLFEAHKMTGPAVSDESEGLHEDTSLLREVTDATELPVLCHGTYSRLWPKIQTLGLRSKRRNHIHCIAVDLADPVNQGRALSGTLGESDVIVYIDAEKAMAEGVVFLWVDDNVVLTRGYPHHNTLPPHLFSGHARWSWEEQQWKAEYSNN
mmetsp:Transcript_44046/g.79755  ORF Transcript_44046/g.79755 Transcript_44046/m.79755 type:complete len:197 (-) Transcript_44046:99-689(-)